jgi:hypothetical protein
MKLLKHLFLIKYIARQGVEMLLPKKRLQKGISFQELVVGLEKLENAKLANKVYQFTMMTRFVASVW